MSTETAHHFFENCGRNPLYNGLNVGFQIAILCEDYSGRHDPLNIPINENQKDLSLINKEAKFIKLFRIPIKDYYIEYIYSLLNIISLMLNVFI